MGIKKPNAALISTAIIWASLLFAGVMLTSCSILSKESKQPESMVEDTREFDRITTILDTMQNSLNEQKSSMENLKQRIETLEKAKETVKIPKISMEQQTSTLKKEPVPEDTKPSLLYKKARSLLLEENFPKASELFKAFVVQHPGSPLADNALYWLGECHYALGDFPDAIKVFKEVVDSYPKGGKVPDALLKTAYSYLSLGDSDRAHHYLKLVVKGYPFTPAGEKAEQKLKTFQ